ncbi:MAG: hypothetical protein IT332_07930 [Ardenticatenales bacterium]|nr:hypothetical protein [Ardenticatenales bacterium]
MDTQVHRDPQSAWSHLCTFGGIDLRGADEGFDRRILYRLNPRASSIEQALVDADMASFVRAFFEELNPYAAMFRDILDFFVHADATRGQSQWTLQVDDQLLGLDHFREWLTVWDDIVKTAVTVPAIDAQACWKLWGVLRNRQVVQTELENIFKGRPLNISGDARQWISTYELGNYSPFPASLHPSELPDALAKCASVAMVVLQRLLDHELTPATLKDLRDQHRTAVGYDAVDDSYDPSDGYNLWIIALHETDYWLQSFVVALSAASQLSESELASIGEELDEITDRFPLRPMLADVSVDDLESVLSMPIWKKRFELYSVWIATEMIRALEGHDIEIHHDNGRIGFDFKETTVATIHSSPGPFKLISERRTPLANPRGKDRKGAVQPDYGLWTEDSGREICKMVVEVKHYKKSSSGTFVDVLEDYASALPDGDIFLVSHGSVAATVSKVSPSLQHRCSAIGHLTSSNWPSRTELASAVRRCVGEPMSPWPAAAQGLNSSKILLVDVSGSMNEILRSAAMNVFVRHVATIELPAVLAAADQRIVGTWETGETGFEEIARLKGDYTQLSQPVAELLRTYETVIVITDEEGVATLQHVDIVAHAAQAVAPPRIEIRVCRKRT